MTLVPHLTSKSLSDFEVQEMVPLDQKRNQMPEVSADLGQAIEQAKRQVFGFLLRKLGLDINDAEDLFQSAATAALKRPEQTPIRTMPQYLMTSCYNLWKNDLRRRQRQTEQGQLSVQGESLDELMAGVASKQITPNQEALSKENITYIDRAISQLPQIQQTVLKLYCFENMSHREIANVLQSSEAGSKWHLFQARRTLKTYFGLGD